MKPETGKFRFIATSASCQRPDCPVRAGKIFKARLNRGDKYLVYVQKINLPGFPADYWYAACQLCGSHVHVEKED